VNEAQQDRVATAEEPMLYGHYERSLDAKKRFNLPFRFREKDLVGEDEPPRLMITQDKEGIVSLMTCRQYEENIKRVKARMKGVDQRNFLRWIARHSQPVPLNSQGRVAVPGPYLDTIGAGKRLLILGVGTRMELWDPASYDAEQDAVGAPSSDCFEAFYD
jgi:MraZ protein